MKIKIGDSVTVSRRGLQYTTFESYFDTYDLSSKLKNDYLGSKELVNGDILDIIALGEHPNRNNHRMLAVVKNADKVGLIEVEGLSECSFDIVIDNREYNVDYDTFIAIEKLIKKGIDKH